jgi:hypothetical protein
MPGGMNAQLMRRRAATPALVGMRVKQRALEGIRVPAP